MSEPERVDHHTNLTDEEIPKSGKHTIVPAEKVSSPPTEIKSAADLFREVLQENAVVPPNRIYPSSIVNLIEKGLRIQVKKTLHLSSAWKQIASENSSSPTWAQIEKNVYLKNEDFLKTLKAFWEKFYHHSPFASYRIIENFSEIISNKPVEILRIFSSISSLNLNEFPEDQQEKLILFFAKICEKSSPDLLQYYKDLLKEYAPYFSDKVQESIAKFLRQS